MAACIESGLKKMNLISFAHSTESEDKNGGIIIPPNLSPDCVKGAMGQMVVMHGVNVFVNTCVSRWVPFCFARVLAISKIFFRVAGEFSGGRNVRTTIPKPCFRLEDDEEASEFRKYSENDCFVPPFFFRINPGGDEGDDDD